MHPIHLVNRMRDPSGGSPWRTISLWKRLRERHPDVSLWASKAPHPAWQDLVPELQQIRGLRCAFPRTGTFVFLGPPPALRSWMWRTRPRRVVLVCNYRSRRRFRARRAHLARHAGGEVEVVYASRWIQQAMGGGGVVHPSPIDLTRFRPLRETSVRTERRFTVGRLSRDDPQKFGEDDPALFRALARDGCRVRVLGGVCLRGALAGADGVELLPVLAEPAEHFLHSLDCFVYRTASRWMEPWGRVVTEAMACGIPVVLEARGGYTEIVEHGVNGLLFTTSEEAREHVRRLRRDPALRERLGLAGRKTVERLLSDEALRDDLDFYLG